MTALRSKAASDFGTKGHLGLWQGHGAKHAFEALEGVVGGRGPALEQVRAVLPGHDDGVAAICGFAGAAEVALEFGHRHLHTNQII
jgi:hypothetical protein